MTDAADHLRAAEAALAKAQEAVASTTTAAQAMRRHRDELIRVTGTEQAFADRHYRSFAAAIAPPQAESTGQDDLEGLYPLVQSADDSYAQLVATANAAAAAAAAAQAHRDRFG